jgi:hypothetical protein
MKLFIGTALFAGHSRKTGKRSAVFCIAVIMSFNIYAQRSEPFLFDCVLPGQDMKIDAVVSAAPAGTYYHWQYKTAGGNWTCFTDGMNMINAMNFDVTGATKNGGANDAPLLIIRQATTILENLLVRLIMGNGSDPCTITSPVWGGDDQSKQYTKYLRLHISSSENVCPPNAYSCAGNKLSDGTDYYGGFESVIYNSSTGSYTSRNFGTNASTDLVPGGQGGGYADINNPYAMNTGFYRDIAPHSGNYQLVVSGPPGTAARSWYKKDIPVIPGSQYRLALWVTRIDNTDPVINLKVTAGTTTTTLMSYDMFTEPIGTWRLVQGNYSVPPDITQVSISINDSRTGGLNNYSVDDICFRECVNCGTLPLHQLELRAYLRGNNVNLKWTAENEMNTSTFIIERCTDGNNFTGIGSKFPSGPLNTPTSYQFDDNILGLPSATIVYYRIKAMDNDSRFAYSNVTTVKLEKTTGVQVWPNPAGSFVNIAYNAASNTTIDISLMDGQGRLVRRESIKVSRGLNQFSINSLGTLPAGMYLIRITDKNTGKIYTEKISK